MKDSVRWTLAALVLGLVGNFIVFQSSDLAEDSAGSGWRKLNLADAQGSASTALLDAMLGIEIAQDAENRVLVDARLDSEMSAFVYDGVVYRLAGLVVGSVPAATLLNDDGTTVRLVPGDNMPGGASVVAIRINEIELRKPNGATEVVEIY